ncbi:hypothetical protein Tco_0868692 [Tanacetum coccineum]
MGINALCIQSDALNQLCAYSVCALRTRPVSALRTQPVCALRTQPVCALRTQPVSALRTQPVCALRTQSICALCTQPVSALRTQSISALRTQSVCALRTQPLRTQPVCALRTQPVWPRTSQIARPEMDPKKVQKHHYQAEMVVVVMVVDYVKVEMYAVSSWENSHTEIYNDLFVCNKHTVSSIATL